MKAYSYLRFSTPEQERGDSYRRQTAMAERYAAQHGLELDRATTFLDFGVSAFRGRNAETGALRVFLRAVEDGDIEAGTWLLVENLDRLSRMVPRKAVRVLEDIVDAGIQVVTLSDGKVWTADILNRDPFSFILAVLTFVRANSESEETGRRLAASWEGRRARAREKPLTAHCPAWLQLNRASGQFEIIEERAAVVRRIFDLTLAGAGINRVAGTLNKERVPSFKQAPYWRQTSVRCVLDNPAVIGTLLPHKLRISPDGKQRRVPLDPVSNYYPAVLDEVAFAKVRAAHLVEQARSRAKSRVRNILGYLARCPACGSSMAILTGGKYKDSLLVCSKARAGAECRYRRVSLAVVQRTIVSRAQYLAAHVPSGCAELDAELKEAELLEHGLGHLHANLIKALARQPSPAVVAELAQVEVEFRAARARTAALLDRTFAAAKKTVARNVGELRAALMGEPLDLARANLALRTCFHSVTVNYQTGCLELAWKHGGTTGLVFAPPIADHRRTV